MKIILPIILIAVAGTAFFFGTGCGTVAPPSSPCEGWAEASDWRKTLDADTVRLSLRDKDFDVSKPLGLNDVVDIALRNNPNTRQAWENARAAYARMKQTDSKYYPQLTVTGEAERSKQEYDEEASLGYDILKYGPGAKISMLLLDTGGRRAAFKEALHNLVALNFQFDMAMQDLVLNAETAYYELYSAKEGLKAAESDVEDARRVFESAQKKLKAGLAVRLDVLQAQSDYEQALYALEESASLVKTAHADVALIMGLAADVIFEITDPAVEPDMELGEDDVSLLIEEALLNRPDIASARASLRSKGFGVRKTDSELWPSLTAGGSAARNWSESYDDNPTGDNYEYMGYIGISWSVFDGFYNLNVKRAAQAAEASEREKLKDAELKASADVWTKYHTFKTNLQKLKYGQASLSSAEASYSLAQEGYNAGLKNILDVLHSQKQLSSARSRLVQSRKDLFVSFASLLHSTGSLRCSKGSDGSEKSSADTRLIMEDKGR